MIPSIVDLVSRTSDRLTGELRVDVGLKKLVKALEKEAHASGAIKLAKDELRTRTRAAKAAVKELEQLRAAVVHVADVFAFTPDGWPELKAELERKLQTDALTGIEAWLQNWLIAASWCRTGALERLESVTLPAGASVLAERCRSARSGLEQHNWHLARPMLEAGANGIAFGDRTIPPKRVRADLRLLLVRLALEQGLLEEADAALVEASAVEPSPALEALNARLLRFRGEPDAAADALAAAAEIAPGDLDVAVELIDTARSRGQRELALDTARGAVAAFTVLVDIEAELGRLVGTPPAVLWAAVAERALAEKDLDVHTYAVERATETVEYGDDVLYAIVAELRAQGAELQGLPEQQAEALIDAGFRRLLAGQVDLAAGHYKRVLRLIPDHDDAALRLADCLITIASSQPLTEARPEIEEALRLIHTVQGRDGIVAGNSWSYLSEAVALERLGEAVGPDARGYNWAAFAAVCRSLVHVPDDPNRWRDLATAAQALGLYEVCVAATERGVELAPYDNDASAALVQSLTNVGRWDAALERLGEPYDQWTRAVKAYILVRKGEAAEAANLLAPVTLDPSWAWAAHTLVSALLATGQETQALVHAEDLRARWARRSGELDAVWVEAWTSVVLGDLETAEQRADALVGSRAQEILAGVRFLRGDAEGGIAALRALVAEASTLVDLDEVPSVIAGTLRALTQMHGLPPPDFAALDDDLAQRRSELAAKTDPYVELAEAPSSESEAGIAGIAKAMGAVLMQLARNDPLTSLAELRALADSHPNDVELRSLVALAETEEPLPEFPALPAPIAAIEDDPTSETVEEGIETVLPTSWFEGHDDPLNDHPLFLRYIPELRARAWWDVPSIHVRVDDELEPDGFRILRLGELVDAGRVSPAHRYAAAETLPLLRSDVVDDAEPDEALGLTRIPADAVETGDGVADLLTLQATEVVVYRLGDIARGDAQEAGRPGRWPKRLVSSLARSGRGS